MRILIVAATGFEILPLREYLGQKFIADGETSFQQGGLQVALLITGVGQTQTSYALCRALCAKPFDLVINAGIAGSFDRKRSLGEVVHVIADTFADLGVEEKDGRFNSVFSMELTDPDSPPFSNGWLLAPDQDDLGSLPKVKGITVNKVHGSENSIRQISEQFPADVETMEGAAVFYVCLNEQVPFLAIRAISNYVEPRNREAWNIPLAIEHLNAVLIELIQAFSLNINDV